jgi:hypothetical protein
MWWECSECGGCLESLRAPLVCPTCGIAGAIFVSAAGPLSDDAEADDPRAHWLLASDRYSEAAAPTR